MPELEINYLLFTVLLFSYGGAKAFLKGWKLDVCKVDFLAPWSGFAFPIRIQIEESEINLDPDPGQQWFESVWMRLDERECRRVCIDHALLLRPLATWIQPLVHTLLREIHARLQSQVQLTSLFFLLFGSAVDPGPDWILIQWCPLIGTYPEPDSQSGSGSRRAKITHKNWKS
jgi:hypothetical protein